MKLKLLNIYIAFIILFLSFATYGQQANDASYIPYDITDCLQYLKKTLHPKTVEEFKKIQKQNYSSSPYSVGLEEYISENWLKDKQGKLFLFMKSNNPKSSNHAPTIVRAFIESLKNVNFNIKNYLENNAEYPEGFPLSDEEYNAKLNLANFYMKGYHFSKIEGDGDVKPQFLVMEKEGKFGFITFDFKILVEPNLDGFEKFLVSERRYTLRIKKGNKLGLVNQNGELLLPVEFDCLSWVARMEENEFISRKEQVWYRYNFDENNSIKKVDFSESVNSNFYRRVPTLEQNFISCDCFSAEDINNEGFSKDNKNTLVEVKTGKEVFEPSINLSFSQLGNEPLVAVFRKNNKMGIVNVKTKEILIPFEYDNFWELNGNNEGKYVMAEKNKKWGIVSDKNQPCVPFSYDAIGKLMSSLTLKKEVIFCLQNNKWGLVDLAGNVIIPFMYDGYDRIFSDGQKDYVIFYQGLTNRQYGAVDISNKIIAPFTFNSEDQLRDYLYNERQKNK